MILWKRKKKMGLVVRLFRFVRGSGINGRAGVSWRGEKKEDLGGLVPSTAIGPFSGSDR